ncbi:hypothetical protein GCM10009416_03670 [Craurococcus roseus]|uniref:Guanylate cyclase domain-containing protein n=1 Tax=Craurococcus roseus TaxID=77585 RepID=A0ABP3PLU7_9PROT
MDCVLCKSAAQTGRFCSACGAKLPLVCPSCRAAADASARFCSDCGHALPSLDGGSIWTERAGERKHVTVLFADLVGSLALLAEDPEEATGLLDAVLDRLNHAVAECGGTVAQETGDGIMALFGAPKACDDHALRACRAALAMREEILALASERAVPLAMRVGIHTGEAVASERGQGRSLYYTARGRTTHLASRMERLAPVNGVLISASTHALAAGWIEAEELGLLSVRGAAAPVQAWLLHRLRDTAVLPDVEWHLTPFVGRDRELALLARLAQEADAGRGRAVLLVGEPGVGKSRLLRELARTQAAAGWDVATTRGVSHLRLPPLHGAVEVLANMLPSGRGAAGPQEIAPELAAHAEALTAMAGKDTSAWRALPPAQRRVQVARAALAALAVRSQGRPLLVLVDDLQWVDPDSREIFRRIADAAGGARMLLVAACRADDAVAHPGAWFHLPLATLDEWKLERLLDVLIGRDPTLDGLRPLLIARTGGNPLFAEEVVRSLAASGVLAGAAGAYRLLKPVPTLGVPARVQDVVASRVDGLPPSGKRALQVAAVCGAEFDLDLLGAVLGIDADALAPHLEQLETLRFVEARDAGRKAFAFRHALIHEVAYHGLLHSEQRAIHALALASLAAANASPDRLAFHAVRAERWADAVHWLELAGQAALSRSACEQAAARFEEAIGLLPRLPADASRDRQEVELRLNLRNALFALGRHSEILDHLEAAAACQARLGDPARLAQIDGYRAHAAWLLGHWREAEVAGRRALAVAERLREPGLLATTRFFLGLAAYSSGNLGAAITYFSANTEEATREAELQRLAFYAPLPAVVSRAWLAWCLAECGRFAEARAQAEAALRIAEAAGRSFDHIQSLLSLGAAWLMQGRWAEALPPLRRARAMCEESGTAVLMPRLSAAFGFAQALAGRHAEAMALEAAAVQGADRLELPAMRPICLRWHAETALLARQRDVALRSAQRLLEEAGASGQDGHAAWATYLRGRLAAEAGEVGPAEADLAAARDAAHRLGLRPLLAHCTFELGRLWMVAGDMNRAQVARAEARALDRAMGLIRPSEARPLCDATADGAPPRRPAALNGAQPAAGA